jgi:hypothetical protein
MRLLLESQTFSGGGVVHIYWEEILTTSSISNMGLLDSVPLPTLIDFTTFVTH